MEILVERGLGISVSDAGYVTAVGTAHNRIKVSGKGGGIWKGFRFLATNATFDLIDLSDGGGETCAGGVSVPAVVTIHAGGTGSLVSFGTSMTISGPDYAIAFGSGDAHASGCQGSVWVPAGQTIGDHCR